ncbi:MAG: beta-propeller domain-containing protein [Clostridia bacterium]|nr:beta-propeller domain-containing protein [Clostridia bacterium]
MNRRNLIDIMDLVDDKFIAEADPNLPIEPRGHHKKFKWSTFILSLFCVLLIVNVIVLVPILRNDGENPTPPVTNSSQGQLNQVQNSGNGSGQKPDDSDSVIVENDKLTDVFDKLFASSTVTKEPDMSFVDLFDKNQVLTQDKNEIKGDFIQKTDKYVYYLFDKELYTYSIEDQGLVSKLSLSAYIDEITAYARSLGNYATPPSTSASGYAYDNSWKMFLSSDQKTLTIIAIPSVYPLTAVFTIDVSRTPTIEIGDYKLFSGSLAYSYKTENELILFTQHKINKNTYNKEKPLSYMPFTVINGKEYVADSIYFPDDAGNSTYIMIAKLDKNGEEILDTSAYLSFNSVSYVFKDNIYLTRSIYKGENGVDYQNPPYDTEIYILDRAGAKYKNKVTISGVVNCIDGLNEYNGILRVASTSFVKNTENAGYSTSISLFFIDLNKMEIVASHENFAEAGQRLYSVCFSGNQAYISTSSNPVDPVYVFDISDLKNITYAAGKTNQDFSAFITDIGGGYFVGIGGGSNSLSLRIEIYKGTNDGFEKTASYEISNTYYSSDYMSYYVDTTSKLIGIAIKTYESTYVDKYLILSYTESSLTQVWCENATFSSRDTVRSFYKNGNYYIVTEDGMSKLALQ